MTSIQELIDKHVKDEQTRCPHSGGMWADESGIVNRIFHEKYGRPNKTSIVWHELIVGAPLVGICTACFRRFVPGDEDYEEWKAKPSNSTVSRAGVSLPYDGQQADYTPLGESFEQPFEPLPPKTLDDLTDEQIKTLLEATRQMRKIGKLPASDRIVGEE